MKTFKTMIMGLALALAPAAAMAQEAAPAATPAAAPAAPAAGAEAVAAKPAFQHMAPTADIGQPIPGGFKLQPQVTQIGHDAQWMHDSLLMPIMTIMSVFVLMLLVWVAIRYRAGANPVPSKTSHNTMIEVVWTLAPVLILLVIAVPSIRLLAHQYAQPKADVTIKVIGNQWYWTYQYPDNGDFELVSNMLPEDKRKPEDGPRLLAVDERVVVPVNKVVKLIVTSNDVIHSFAVPAFWTKMDAVPGRLNETWFKAEKEGLYFGQCSELCGARHGYMPIAVEVVSDAKYAEWVRSKGGKMPGEGEAAAAPAAAPAPAAAAPAEAAPAGENAAEPAASQPAQN
ncbi:cytochrome c oxidase subunit II [Sphingomonas crocodyli]|uniref:Cytochrome c oxidase subunit 2 n=1 Tax=Sphingomonas crocodyli TaxID=1979270 RepID=A0A437M0N4_9SPHN|nr:cytochrome c oxidase subunit II [Sphingomonas crocodyli]RVT91260.1 cytochrome c oxidase subunit II [Sphingomonas crocodyli]